MVKTYTLYGVAMARGAKGSLSDQLYGVLRHEVLKGRWAIGEQLPSYTDLSAACGLSRSPVQEAYNRLEADGYVERIRQKGSFVKSTISASNSTIGRIVFAIHGTDEELVAKTQTFGFWDLEAIVEDATRRGFRAEVVRVDTPSNQPEGLAVALQEDVFGIISLVPSRWLQPLIADRDMPVVYLGVDDPFSSPSLVGDLFTACHLLTGHLIQLKHKKIGLFVSPGMDAHHLNQVLRGHRAAMTEAGLDVNDALIEWSHKLGSLALKDMQSFFDRLGDTTAVLSTSGDEANKLIEVADFLGVDVPGQLSVACTQVSYLRGNLEETVLGAYYNWDTIVEQCFSILLDHDARKHSEMLRQVYSPHIKVEDSTSVRALTD